MSGSKRLAAYRASAPIADDKPKPALVPSPADQPDEDESVETSMKKESPMTEEEIAAANAKAASEAAATATAAANKRFSTVIASEHYAGREKLAQSLLGNDAMTAEAIVAALELAPKAAAPGAADLTEEQKRAAAEEAGRKEMKAALEETGNSNINAENGNGGGAADDQAKIRAASDAVWTKAYGLKTPA